jgi:hypothetical protein
VKDQAVTNQVGDRRNGKNIIRRGIENNLEKNILKKVMKKLKNGDLGAPDLRICPRKVLKLGYLDKILFYSWVAFLLAIIPGKNWL